MAALTAIAAMATIEPGEQSRMMIPFSLAAYYFNHFGQPRYPKIATISGPKIASALDRSYPDCRRAKAIHRKLSQGCRSAIVLRSGLTHAWVDRHRRYPRVSGPLRYRADGCGILQDVSPHQQSLSCRWSVAESIAWRSLRPLPCSTRSIMRSESI